MFSEQTKQLADESQRMEERLRTLKEMMKKEKAKRESNSGVFWQSGQKGAVLKYAADKTTKKTTIPVKGHPVKVQVLSDKNDDPKLANSPNSKKSSYCGECGKKTRTLSRTKSGMPVCTECHTRYTNKQPKLAHTNAAKPKRIDTHSMNGGSLLEGTYDEEANAAAFAEALAEWRNGGNSHKVGDKADSSVQSVSDSSTSSQTMTSTETNTVTHPPAVDVGTRSSISYLERLMIRRNRYDPKFLHNTVTPNPSISKPATSPIANDIQDNPVEPSPYNVFYEAPYQQKTIQNSAVADFTSDVTTPTNGVTDNYEASCDPIVPLQFTAMQVSIKEAWTSNETAGNLSQFFLSGVKETTDTVVVSKQHKRDEQNEGILTKTTGTWQPELSTTNDITASQTDEHCTSDSDDDTVLNIDDSESDNEEWELDDKMTLECLERELRASQLGWSVDHEQYHQTLNNCDSDFEDIEKQLQKDEQ